MTVIPIKGFQPVGNKKRWRVALFVIIFISLAILLTLSFTTLAFHHDSSHSDHLNQNIGQAQQAKVEQRVSKIYLEPNPVVQLRTSISPKTIFSAEKSTLPTIATLYYP